MHSVVRLYCKLFVHVDKIKANNGDTLAMSLISRLKLPIA